MPRRRSLFSSSVRSKRYKTLVHSCSSSPSCSIASKENAPSSSCFSSLSSNQAGPPIAPKICLLPLSSFQTTPYSQQLTTCSQFYTSSSAYKIGDHVGLHSNDSDDMKNKNNISRTNLKQLLQEKILWTFIKLSIMISCYN